jgi:hypothetical protein
VPGCGWRRSAWRSSHLDAGQAGLVVVAVTDMGAKVEQAMKRAEKLEQKQLDAYMTELERDAASVEGKLY